MASPTSRSELIETSILFPSPCPLPPGEGIFIGDGVLAKHTEVRGADIPFTKKMGHSICEITFQKIQKV